MLPAKSCFLSTVLVLSMISATSVFAQASPLTLKECLEQAMAGNPALRLARHDSGIQTENINLADSGYLPRVDLQAGFTSLLDPQAIITPGGSFETQQASFPYVSASVYQTLYDFGRRDRRKEQATLQGSAVASGLGSVRQDVSLQVIKGYFGILQAMKLVEAASDEVVQREQHQKNATILYEEGVTTRNDLLQAEVKLAGSRQRLLVENSRLTNSWLFLNYLSGKPPEYRATLAEETGIEKTADKLERNLLGKRDEIAAQKSMIKSTESLVEESREEFYPELFLKVGIDYLQNNKVVEQTMAGATIGLKVNLFDGMATTSRQRQAVKLLEKEKERLRGLEEGFLLEFNSASNDVSVAAERIEVTRTAIRQSEENLRINNDRYKAQVGTATEVIDAQTLLSQTKSEHYQALFDYQVAKARVKRASGEL